MSHKGSRMYIWRFVGVGDGLGLSSLSLGLCSCLSQAAGPPVLMAVVSSRWTWLPAQFQADWRMTAWAESRVGGHGEPSRTDEGATGRSRKTWCSMWYPRQPRRHKGDKSKITQTEVRERVLSGMDGSGPGSRRHPADRIIYSPRWADERRAGSEGRDWRRWCRRLRRRLPHVGCYGRMAPTGYGTRNRAVHRCNHERHGQTHWEWPGHWIPTTNCSRLHRPRIRSRSRAMTVLENT
jgi:hypothetical protein